MNPKTGIIKEDGKYYLLCGNKRVAVRFEALGDKPEKYEQADARSNRENIQDQTARHD